MNKLEIQKRVLKNGEPLSLDKFTWCKKTKTFSTNENNLVLDFNFINDITFNTGSCCTFNTNYNCTFNTGSCCTFNTASGCTFKTGSYCTFSAICDCTFNTSYNCVVIRRDVFEVIKLKKDQKIKLNGFEVLGYEIIEEKVTIELTQEQLDKIKHLI